LALLSEKGRQQVSHMVLEDLSIPGSRLEFGLHPPFRCPICLLIV
jgi:hypothetical protein